MEFEPEALDARRDDVRGDARTALLEAALEALATNGPAAVHPQELCQQLGVSKALVNYHFGNRDRLIAEAAALGYERYVEVLELAAEAAVGNAVDRVLAWFDAQVDWSTAHPGLTAFLNFPTVAIELDFAKVPEIVERFRIAGERNFATVRGLVTAARDEVDPRRDPDHVTDGLDAATIGWLTLGISVFSAGRHLPTAEMALRDRLPIGREHVRGLVRELLTRG